MGIASNLNRLMNIAILYLFLLFVVLPYTVFVYPFILVPACFFFCILPLCLLSFLYSVCDVVARINFLFRLGLERARSSSAASSSSPAPPSQPLQATPTDDVVQS